MRVDKAVYKTVILPEYKGNPLIESLPIKLNDEDLVEILRFYPECSLEERSKLAFERVEYLTRLKTLRQPQYVYFDVFRAVETALKEGYSAKNPLSPTTVNYLHYSVSERPDIEPRTGFFNPKGCGITVIGKSGVGKTCMLEQVLNYFPDVIDHQSYQNKLLPLRQVVWIKVDCPDDSSVKGLCHRILDQLDSKLEHGVTKPAGTIAQLINQIEARIKSSFLGILVIDEMQNINLGKAGGAERLLGFLHNLVNNLGIPLLFCANPPFDEILSKSLKAARRAESGGYFDVELLDKDDGSWDVFVEELWELQWTDVVTPLTDELSYKLYNLSVGNMDLAVRIFAAAQRAIIGSIDERITPSVLELGASNAIRASRVVTNELRNERAHGVLKRNKKSQSTSSHEIKDNADTQAQVVTVTKNKLVNIPGDLSRAHHPEFAEGIIALLDSDEFNEKVIDPDLIQRASSEAEPLNTLKKVGVFCENPLELFA